MCIYIYTYIVQRSPKTPQIEQGLPQELQTHESDVCLQQAKPLNPYGPKALNPES